MEQSGSRLNRQALFGMMVFAAAGAMPAYAATITVDPAAVDEGTVVSARDKRCSLREAVLSVNAGANVGDCVAVVTEAYGTNDTITMPAGTYTLTVEGVDETAALIADPANPSTAVIVPNANIGDLDISKSVRIIGAGTASLTPTIIQWDTATAVANRDRIFHVNAATGTLNVMIQGVVLKQGYTNQANLGPGPVGVGPLATTYYLRRAGGALAVGPAAAVVLVDPNIVGDENTEGRGGSNTPPDEGETGATMSIALTDVIVDGNHADGDGGGIYAAAAMTAAFTIVLNNDSITNGGGIYNEGATSITNSTISGNIAEGGGGVFLTGSNIVTITGSTLSGNRAVGGGAVSCRADVTINMVNSTLSGNLAEDVGAGLYTNGIASLRFVTIANNITGAESGTAGAGINTFPSGAVAVTLKNVLLADNKKGWEFATYANPANDPTLFPANCGSTDPNMKITSNGYNLSSDDTCNAVLTLGTDIKPTLGLTISQLIGPLADNNAGTTGTTLTHALLASSLALGNGGAEGDVTVDQRGVARENPPDIGAFELANIGGGGGGGGGCAVGGEGRLDPTLPAMLAAGLGFFGWRRFKAGK